MASQQTIKIILLTIISGWLLIPIVIVLAQNQNINQNVPEIILTWQANNFFPSNYNGRAWPTFNSNLKVSLEVIQNNKILDVSEEEFYWYVDDVLIRRGIGLKNINFQITNYEGENHLVYVVIKQKNGERIESAVQIPVFQPQIILENNQRSFNWPAETIIQTTIIPYFFNVVDLNDLNFKWSINNQTQNIGYQFSINTGRPLKPNDNQLFLKILVENKKNPSEFLEKIFKITIY